MGYYFDIIETTFVIPATKVTEARDLLVASLPDFYDTKALATEDLVSVLDAIWYGASVCENGDVAIYSGQSKYLFQMRLLNPIAHLLPAGSYAIWRGEEGDLRRQFVRDGRMVEQQGEVVFR